MPGHHLDKSIDGLDAQLRELSLAIHGFAETGRNEHRSSALCAQILERAGFQVEMGTGNLDTAFAASLPGAPGAPTLALLAEYDALPGVGHGCAHNVNAAATIGAALALAGADLHGCTLKVLGTPAEEDGFGKPAMIDAGWFDGISSAFQVHGDSEVFLLAGTNAVRALDIRFTGVTSHAGASPWLGRSALDAVIMLFNGVNSLRQFIPDGERIHGMILQAGEAYNSVPEHAWARIGTRAPSRERVEELRDRVLRCAEAAALATGTEVLTSPAVHMDEIRYSGVLGDRVHRHLEELGVTYAPPRHIQASTDFGNVSQLMPVAHLMVKTWEPDVSFHTHEAAAASCQPLALDSMIVGAKVLARMVSDLATEEGLLDAARAEHAQADKQRLTPG